MSKTCCEVRNLFLSLSRGSTQYLVGCHPIKNEEPLSMQLCVRELCARKGGEGESGTIDCS